MIPFNSSGKLLVKHQDNTNDGSKQFHIYDTKNNSWNSFEADFGQLNVFSDQVALVKENDGQLLVYDSVS